MRSDVAVGLTVLGQALIQHDLHADHWPDFAAFAAMLEERLARAAVSITAPPGRHP